MPWARAPWHCERTCATTACRWGLTSSPWPSRRLGPEDWLDPCLTAAAQEQGHLSSRDQGCNPSFPCELPNGEGMCRSFHTGCVYYKHMFSWRLDTPCYHPSDPHLVHLWLLRHYSPQQPCWLHCRAGLLPLAWAHFALPFGFLRVLTQPCIMSILNSHLLLPLCVYALLRLQVVLSFPTLSFFMVYKSEPCICTAMDTHYTHYRISWIQQVPSWVRTGITFAPWAPPASPGQLTGKMQGPNNKLFCSPAFRTWSPTTEEEKYPSQLTLSGSLSKRKMLSPCRFWGSINVWSQEKPEGALSPLARSCQGQTLNCPSAPPHMEAPASATGRICCTFWAPVQAFPPKWPGTTLEVRGSSSATTHPYKERRDSRKLRTNGHCM